MREREREKEGTGNCFPNRVACFVRIKKQLGDFTTFPFVLGSHNAQAHILEEAFKLQIPDAKLLLFLFELLC